MRYNFEWTKKHLSYFGTEVFCCFFFRNLETTNFMTKMLASQRVQLTFRFSREVWYTCVLRVCIVH